MKRKFCEGCFDIAYPEKITQSIWNEKFDKQLEVQMKRFPVADIDYINIGATDDGELLCEFKVVRFTLSECNAMVSTIKHVLQEMYGDKNVTLNYSVKGEKL